MADSFLLSWDVTAGNSRALGNCAKVQCYVTERIVPDRARVDFRLNDDMRVVFSLLQKEKNNNKVQKEYKDWKKQLAPSINEVVSLHHYITLQLFYFRNPNLLYFLGIYRLDDLWKCKRESLYSALAIGQT